MNLLMLQDQLSWLFDAVETRQPTPQFKAAIAFVSDDVEYIVSERPAEGDDSGFVLCIMQARKPRPGEWWRRSRDMGDGPPGEVETWARINNRVVASERERGNLREFVPPKRPSVH